jgi:hypothetical protein
MSYPDPLFDPENTLEDDMSYNDDEQFYMEREFTGNFGGNCDDHDDFQYGEDISADDIENMWDEEGDEGMDGDHDSAMTSCGWGTDEDYGNFGENDDDSFFGEDY